MSRIENDKQCPDQNRASGEHGEEFRHIDPHGHRLLAQTQICPNYSTCLRQHCRALRKAVEMSIFSLGLVHDRRLGQSPIANIRPDYVAAEAEARKAEAGIWRGDFVPPWDWRHGQHTDAANDNQPGAKCIIEGNINARGEHIYHVPGGKSYDRTRIDPSTGERWFCSEAEARAAGWRRSKR